MSCTALDHVEVVRIEGDAFRFLAHTYPDLVARLDRECEQYVRTLRASDSRLVPMGEFVDQRLFEGQSLLLLDLEKCTRCDECVKACVDAHDESRREKFSITRLVREGLRFDKYLIPMSCRSCLDPVCMPVCPVGAIRRNGPLEILIETWCVGCIKCSEACPYGNIELHERGDQEKEEKEPDKEKDSDKKKEAKKAPAKIAATCDLCHGSSEPACVYACPHDAAHRVNAIAFYQSGFDVQASKSHGG